MTNKKHDLGQGIRALLQNMTPTAEGDPSLLSTSMQVPLEAIEINPFQPRHDFDPQALEELARSIRMHGIIQPITVRRLGPRKYQLISGERRLRAARLAGLREIPCFVRTANDEQMLEMALIENTHRENLNAIEIAINYKRLIDECNLKPEELAERVGRDRTTVVNFLRLLKLPPEIQQAIRQRIISMAHARALINVEDPVVQLRLFRDIVQRQLSVRQTEALVRQLNRPQQRRTSKPSLPPAYKQIQNRLASHLATRVSIKKKGSGRGEISIEFYSDDDLQRLLELLLP
ncbi:MAG: ParB/RepB/Spo0J family partition protein [Chitinophagales bacterium]|nr:ParB/RepB/Spo0J family partition protein [Chitinophagales bacterium]MDW8427984.1 ParB/RepB/Spo0J family partition protein [Chitinophagales bacterium]